MTLRNWDSRIPHTLTVITEAHLLLAETNGVFSLTDAIVLLQLGLVNALEDVLVFASNDSIALDEEIQGYKPGKGSRPQWP